MATDIEQKLKEPFDPREMHWRVGSTNAKKLNVKPWEATKGIPLAYIDARNVMDRLDDVMGFGNWQDEYREVRGRTICRISLKIGGEWVYREDGAGDTQMEGEKGGISDAFKRAAVKWGIGRYLYSLGARWCDLQNGQPVMKQYKDNGIAYNAPYQLPVSAIPIPPQIARVRDPIREYIEMEDDKGVSESFGQLTNEQKEIIWGYFKYKEQQFIRMAMGNNQEDQK